MMVYRPLMAGLVLLVSASLQAAEWQWSAEVEGAVSGETGRAARAFLWIPPSCERVRGVVVAQHNMEEEGILEHPLFRKKLSELGFAAIWVTPGWNLFFRFDRGAGEGFEKMMKALAGVSGYAELLKVPVVPLGHSAAASYPWNFAAWKPERTLAILSVSGQWPYYKDENTPDWGSRTVAGVPGLVTMGEYEAAQDRAGEGVKQRREHPNTLLSMLAEPGGGHFEYSDDKVGYLALYLEKACAYRLPETPAADGATALKSIDPAQEGWLADRWRGNEPPRAQAAPVGKYRGDAGEAFWFFDEELAKATEELQAKYRGKKTALLGFVQKDGITEQNPKLHAQVPLKFEPQDDGITFKLKGAFLDTVPEGRPEGWTGLPKGAAVEHPGDPGRIEISRICGPVEKLDPETFALRFYRMGMDNQKRSNDIWLAAVYPGDGRFRRCVQQAQMRFPLRNTAGQDQQIDFPELPDQKEGVERMALNASSSAGVPVQFYVREGPAEVRDGQLVFTKIPPRAAFPIRVTVVAWQWGRLGEPKLKTAEPVERQFNIVH